MCRKLKIPFTESFLEMDRLSMTAECMFDCIDALYDQREYGGLYSKRRRLIDEQISKGRLKMQLTQGSSSVET